MKFNNILLLRIMPISTKFSKKAFLGEEELSFFVCF